MSQASNMVNSFKHNNKENVLNNIKKMATHKAHGEDTLYYFNDESIAIHKTIINDVQLFKG